MEKSNARNSAPGLRPLISLGLALPPIGYWVLAAATIFEREGSALYLLKMGATYAILLPLLCTAILRGLLPRVARPAGFYALGALTAALAIYVAFLGLAVASAGIGMVYENAMNVVLLLAAPALIAVYGGLMVLPFFVLYSLAFGWALCRLSGRKKG